MRRSILSRWCSRSSRRIHRPTTLEFSPNWHEKRIRSAHLISSSRLIWQFTRRVGHSRVSRFSTSSFLLTPRPSGNDAHGIVGSMHINSWNHGRVFQIRHARQRARRCNFRLARVLAVLTHEGIGLLILGCTTDWWLG